MRARATGKHPQCTGGQGTQAVTTSGQLSVMVELPSPARQSDLGPHLDKTLHLTDPSPVTDLVKNAKKEFLFNCH